MSPYGDMASMSAYLDIAAMSAYADIVSASTILNARSLPQLGQAVRRLRAQRGLTQVALADLAGVSRQWIISIEQGTTPGMEIGVLMRVLDKLDASLTIRDDSPATGGS